MEQDVQTKRSRWQRFLARQLVKVRRHRWLAQGIDWGMDFSRDLTRSHAGVHSAAASFYLFLSLVPILILFCTALSYIPLDGEVILAELSELLPPSMSTLITQIISAVDTRFSPTFIVITILITIWSAAKLFSALIYGLEEIYGKKKPTPYLRRRLRACLYTVILILCTFVYFALFTIVDKLGHIIEGLLPGIAGLFLMVSKLSFLLVIIILFLAFALIYRWVPSASNRFVAQLPGAAFVAIVWSVFSWLFSLYTNTISIYNAYGIIGTVLLAMLWVYFCIWFFFLGAALNQFIARQRLKWRVLRDADDDTWVDLSAAELTADLGLGQDEPGYVSSVADVEMQRSRDVGARRPHDARGREPHDAKVRGSHDR